MVSPGSYQEFFKHMIVNHEFDGDVHELGIGENICHMNIFGKASNLGWVDAHGFTVFTIFISFLCECEGMNIQLFS